MPSLARVSAKVRCRICAPRGGTLAVDAVAEPHELTLGIDLDPAIVGPEVAQRIGRRPGFPAVGAGHLDLELRRHRARLGQAPKRQLARLIGQPRAGGQQRLGALLQLHDRQRVQLHAGDPGRRREEPAIEPQAQLGGIGARDRRDLQRDDPAPEQGQGVVADAPQGTPGAAADAILEGQRAPGRDALRAAARRERRVLKLDPEADDAGRRPSATLAQDRPIEAQLEPGRVLADVPIRRK